MKNPSVLKSVHVIIIAAVALLNTALPGFAIDIQEFTTPRGIKAYLVEDYTSPIITVSFSFKGGATQDPQGREGVTRILAAMLDEGAGEMNSEAYQAKAEKLGMEIGFSVNRDSFTGSMQTLVGNSAQSFELLNLALNKPRFDAQPMERMRQAILLGLKRAQTNPQSISSKALRTAIFKNHPYGRSSNGSIEGVEAVDKDDLFAAYKQILVRDGLVIGVVGAIGQKELMPLLDAAFAALPQKSEMRPVPEADLKFGLSIDKQMEIPQSIISFAYPGVKRADPDFFAAYLANHILGGGTFSSRLYNEVREKRGLAYSVYSHIATYSHAAFTIVGSATSNDRVSDTIEVIRRELQLMAEKGPSAKELEAAKKYIIGSYAIRNLDTSTKVANVLVAIQEVNLGIDYIDRRADLINAVTLEDVRRMAAKLLRTKPTLVIVGPANS